MVDVSRSLFKLLLRKGCTILGFLCLELLLLRKLIVLATKDHVFGPSPAFVCDGTGFSWLSTQICYIFAALTQQAFWLKWWSLLVPLRGLPTAHISSASLRQRDRWGWTADEKNGLVVAKESSANMCQLHRHLVEGSRIWTGIDLITNCNRWLFANSPHCLLGRRDQNAPLLFWNTFIQCSVTWRRNP